MFSKNARRIAIVMTCLVLAGCVIAVGMAWLVLGGWVTRTESPNAEQVAYCREFFYIDPELEIEPLGYFVKHGMDYQARFKFIARTDEPTFLFNDTQVDTAEFSANFKFPPQEPTANEDWWDVSSQTLTGGNFWVPKSAKRFWRLSIGYFKNGDSTLTVYVWRHET